MNCQTFVVSHQQQNNFCNKFLVANPGYCYLFHALLILPSLLWRLCSIHSAILYITVKFNGSYKHITQLIELVRVLSSLLSFDPFIPPWCGCGDESRIKEQGFLECRSLFLCDWRLLLAVCIIEMAPDWSFCP